MKKLILILVILYLGACARIEVIEPIPKDPQHPSINVPATLNESTWGKDGDTVVFSAGKYILRIGDTLEISGEFHYKLPEGMLFLEKRDEVKDGWTVYKQNNLVRYSDEQEIIIFDCNWSHFINYVNDDYFGLKTVLYKKN